MMSLGEVNALGQVEFIAQFGAAYEHSPWVAERAYSQRPFASVTALAAAMASVVESATTEEKLGLLHAHPDLAGRMALAGELTVSSTEEQASAGLDQLTENEMESFQRMNAAYRERFDFPFIIAVKHWGKLHLLYAYNYRLKQSHDEEMRTALEEVNKIAFLRLLALVTPAPGGRLTTHVLDTARGCPAAGMLVQLCRAGDSRSLIFGVTNADGRLDNPLLTDGGMIVGRYELSFAAGEYFLANGLATSVPSFLDRVPIHFAIANPEAHYHVPLLLSPWSYSTYRGS